MIKNLLEISMLVLISKCSKKFQYKVFSFIISSFFGGLDLMHDIIRYELRKPSI